MRRVMGGTEVGTEVRHTGTEVGYVSTGYGGSEGGYGGTGHAGTESRYGGTRRCAYYKLHEPRALLPGTTSQYQHFPVVLASTSI
eukprot:3273370-Rhodomonas_salina.1